MIKVSRNDVIAIMREMGFPMAKGWSKPRTRKKLVEVAEMAESGGLAIEENDKLDADEAGRLDGILQAVVAAGGVVEVLKDGETDLGGGDAEAAGPALGGSEAVVETEDKPPADEKPRRRRRRSLKPEKAKAAAEKRAEKKKAEERAEKKKAEKDAFGNRLGTKAARFCACLSKDPKTMKELVDEMGDGKVRYNLMKRLYGEGFVVKEEDGFRIV